MRWRKLCYSQIWPYIWRCLGTQKQVGPNLISDNYITKHTKTWIIISLRKFCFLSLRVEIQEKGKKK